MTGKYRRGGYVKKEDGFSGHVKEKEGLGISAIFIKNTKPARSWFWRG